MSLTIGNNIPASTLAGAMSLGKNGTSENRNLHLRRVEEEEVFEPISYDSGVQMNLHVDLNSRKQDLAHAGSAVSFAQTQAGVLDYAEQVLVSLGQTDSENEKQVLQEQLNQVSQEKFNGQSIFAATDQAGYTMARDARSQVDFANHDKALEQIRSLQSTNTHIRNRLVEEISQNASADIQPERALGASKASASSFREESTLSMLTQANIPAKVALEVL